MEEQTQQATSLGGMSRQGVAPAALAVVGLCGGIALLRHFGLHSTQPGRLDFAAFAAGALGLGLAGWMANRLVRRGDYPWLMFVAAVAMPLFEPQNKPDRIEWRLFGGAYGLVLVVLAVYAFARMVARTDELERRVNREALSFAFGGSLVLAIGWSLLQDLLPALQGRWVAAGMIAAWLVGWNLAWRRYR